LKGKRKVTNNTTVFDNENNRQTGVQMLVAKSDSADMGETRREKLQARWMAGDHKLLTLCHDIENAWQKDP